jgi:micrococcal nuclease
MKERAGKRLAARRIAAVCLGFLLGAACGWSAAAGDTFPETGRVVRVADGDTITVRSADGGERRVRLIGVDAPEMNDKREDVALRAFLSRRFASHHLYRRDVRLTYDFQPVDEHGRVLAYVWLEEGTLFNELIIRQGFAAAFLKYPFRKDYQDRFRSAEAEARAKKRGFWHPEEAAVPASEAPDHVGEAGAVRFRCAEISRKRSYVYLRSPDGGFEALIPRARLAAFAGLSGCLGKEIVVSGFLELYKGRPQIMLVFPRQLRLT